MRRARVVPLTAAIFCIASQNASSRLTPVLRPESRMALLTTRDRFRTRFRVSWWACFNSSAPRLASQFPNRKQNMTPLIERSDEGLVAHVALNLAFAPDHDTKRALHGICTEIATSYLNGRLSEAEVLALVSSIANRITRASAPSRLGVVGSHQADHC